MLHTLTSQVGLIVLAGVCLLALAKGGPAERFGAVLVAVTWAGLLICQALTEQTIPEIPLLVSDVVLATGFLALAVRYASLWLGAGMLFQGAAFTMHLMHMTDLSGASGHHDRAYVVTVNLLSYAVLATLGGAAVVNWRRRVKAAKQANPLPPSSSVTGP
jgi:hypothetical protein